MIVVTLDCPRCARCAEVAHGWARYDEKVDIFSLGVVAFELWHPFATGMERAALLRELQERGGLPAAWEAAHPQVCLVSCCQSLSPSTTQDALHACSAQCNAGSRDVARQSRHSMAHSAHQGVT